MEYKGRAFAMMYEDRIVLKLDDGSLPDTETLGWQYYKPYGQPVYLQKWVEVPFYYHTDWHSLLEQALDGMKITLGD